MFVKRLLPVILLAFTVACPTDNVPTLAGTWHMVAYRADGVDAVITGTITFHDNGTVSTLGEVTFPGEPADSLTDSGTWDQQGATLHLAIGGDTGTWALDFDGDAVVVLQLQGDASASRLTLARNLEN